MKYALCKQGQDSRNSEHKGYEFMNNLLTINTFFFLEVFCNLVSDYLSVYRRPTWYVSMGNNVLLTFPRLQYHQPRDQVYKVVYKVGRMSASSHSVMNMCYGH
jgi:hypothetical protein